jgi:mannose-6-phosphate isomerase-like protein (cupin superfamily)
MQSNFNARRSQYGDARETNSNTDHGPEPYVTFIERATLRNSNYRTALWTGEHLQLTLMSIDPGEDIGLEIHPDTDQFLRLEQGNGIVRMGKNMEEPDFEARVRNGDAILIPAGTWHNVINTGRVPLKLYSIYAPPHHPHGTVQTTKEEAEQEGR